MTDSDTINVNITPVNDAPAGTNATLTINEDTPRSFAAADFGFTDPNDAPTNALLSVRISTLPVTGRLTLSGVVVTAGQDIPVASLGSLVWTPPTNASGNGLTSFTFQVQDDGGTANGGIDRDPTPNTITFNVTPVADAPTLYAHVTSAIQVAGGTTIFQDNFNDGKFAGTVASGNTNGQIWTALRIHTDTFTPDPLFGLPGGKTKSDATLFATNDAGGQTGSDANFAAKFTDVVTAGNGVVNYNLGGGGGSDDAQGILAYQNLSVADKARTSYVFSVDMDGNTNPLATNQQNNGVGLVFGYTDVSNFFIVRWENPGTDYLPTGSQYNFYPGQANQLSLVQIKAGVAIDLGIYTTSFLVNGVFTLRVGVDTSGIDVYSSNIASGNAPLIHYNYGSVAGGAASGPALNTIGLYTYDNDAGVSFDNVLLNTVAYKYNVDLLAYLNDRDGSETLSSVTFSGIPAGVTLTDSFGTPIVVVAGSATIAVTDSTDTIFSLNSATAISNAQINTLTASITSTDGVSTSTVISDVKLEITGDTLANTINGTASADWINGGAGNDTINGGAGNDVIIGGTGNDSMDGGLGVDVFKYQLAENSISFVTRSQDTITNFGTAAGTDKLDLRDLLTGESAAGGNLQNYLHFASDGAGGTVVHISKTGGFSADAHTVGGAYTSANETQQITLVTADFVTGNPTDAQIIAILQANNKLITD